MAKTKYKVGDVVRIYSNDPNNAFKVVSIKKPEYSKFYEYGLIDIRGTDRKLTLFARDIKHKIIFEVYNED